MQLFRIRKTAASIVTILFVLISLSPSAQAAFADISKKSKYADAVRFLENKGAVQSAASDAFQPDEFISKKEFAKWLMASAGFKKENFKLKTSKKLKDVPEDNEFAPYIYELLALGAIPYPSNKLFHPNAPVKIVDSLRMTFFVKGIPVPKIFPDNEWPFDYLDKEAKYAPYIHKAAELSVFDATKRILPAFPLKRGNAAILLKKTSEEELAQNKGMITVTFEPSSANGTIAANPKYPILKDAFERILNSYLKKDALNKDDLLYGAVSGMVKSLNDTHSEFTKPTEESVLQSLSGEIEGIGAVIQAAEDGKIIIISPIKKSPAEAAGLLPNDAILEVNGEKITGLTASQAADKIRGPAGTQVTLKIQRDGKTFEVTITREKIHIASAEISFTEDNIAVITINNFGSTLNIEFMKILVEINTKIPKGIVIDLRNNPGGFLEVATSIAGYFIEQGKVVAKVRYPNRIEEQVSQGSGVLKKYPVAVIINKGSASASEILAGALQDYGAAKIIGETSFGKGTVQELTTYTDGSTIKITVAEWLTPKDRSIEKTGITPDIEVKRTEDDIKNKLDPQMDRALEELRK